MRQLLAFVTLLLAGMVIDTIWFSLIASPYYLEALGPLLRQSESGFHFDILTAITVYTLLILGIMVFVLPRANRNSKRGAFWGAVYGAIIYGIYDFTNYSTLNGWPMTISLVDIGWGIVYCGIMSMLAVFLQKRWNL